MSDTLSGMRKSLALAVVSLLALTGCAAPTVVESAPATVAVAVTATPEAKAQVASSPASAINPDAGVEADFYLVTKMRADVHGVTKHPSEKAVASALQAFCEDGKPFKVSKSAALNANLSLLAERGTCDKLAN